MSHVNTAETKNNTFIRSGNIGRTSRPEFNVASLAVGALVDVSDNSCFHPKQLAYLSNYAKWSSNNFQGRIVSATKESIEVRRADGHVKKLTPGIHSCRVLTGSPAYLFISKQRGLLPTPTPGHLYNGELPADLKTKCFKLAVTGSVTFSDYPLLAEKLSKLLMNRHDEPIVIVSSGQQGVELLAEFYAHELNLIVLRVQHTTDVEDELAAQINASRLTDMADACVVLSHSELNNENEVVKKCKEKQLPLRFIRLG